MLSSALIQGCVASNGKALLLKSKVEDTGAELYRTHVKKEFVQVICITYHIYPF